MLAETFVRARVDRLIAAARLVLALFAAAAISLDPGQPIIAAGVTYALLLRYVTFAAGLLVATSTRLVSGRPTLGWHVADLAVFTWLMVATEGSNSPFLLLFTFSVISATFRWQWRGALWTSTVVLLLFAVVAVAHSLIPANPAIEVDRPLLRCVQVVVTGAMQTYFGYYNERTFRMGAARQAAISEAKTAIATGRSKFSGGCVSAAIDDAWSLRSDVPSARR